MPLILINFIRQHWLAAIAALLAAVIVAQHFHINYLDKKLSEYKSVNGLLENANKRLGDSLETQNAAVGKLKAASDQKSRAADEALGNAKKVAAGYEAKAERLKAQATSGNDCADMLALINNYSVSK